MTKKRGNPPSLTPEFETDMERLWCRSAIPLGEITERLNAKHGTTFETRNIEWHARRRGWLREMMSRSFNHRVVVEERLLTQSLARSYRPCEDNPVRRVAPGTFAGKGFRMGTGS